LIIRFCARQLLAGASRFDSCGVDAYLHPFADPEAVARKLMEIANSVELVQGRSAA
jgi:hypothetical protein